MKAVAFGPAAIAVGTFEKFVADSGAPARSERRNLGKFREMLRSRVFTADHHGKSVFESQWLGHFESETACVFLLHAPVNRGGIARGRFAENGGQRGAGGLSAKRHNAAQKCIV